MDYLPKIVKVAKAFQELSVASTFVTDSPAVVAAWMREKAAYRRVPIDKGVWLKPEKLKLGKQKGLIFVCKPDPAQNKSGFEYDYCELGWREVSDVLPQMYEAIIPRLRDERPAGEDTWHTWFGELNDTIVKVFKENPAMLKAAAEGLDRALESRRDWVQGINVEQDHPAYGIF